MRTIASCGLAAVAILIAGSANAQIHVDPSVVRPQGPADRFQPHGPFPTVQNAFCTVDPAITSVVLTKGATYGSLQVSAEVRNLGPSAWRSGPTQQNLTVHIHNNGTGRDNFRVFPLAAMAGPSGGMMGAVSTPMLPGAIDGGEFAGDVVVQIGYDPDIRIDANPCNDDANMGNNMIHLDNGAIADFMRSPARQLRLP